MARKAHGSTATSTGTGRGGRRTAAKKSREFPLMPVAVGGILLAFAIGLIIYIVANNKPAPAPQTTAGIQCDQLEHSKVHYHTAIQIVYQGTVHPIPSNLGIVTDSSGNPNCFYWIHVHAGQPNVIHIEAPASQKFNLGQFFAIWEAWNKSMGQPQAEPLDTTHVSTFTLTPDQKLVVWVDEGTGSQVYTGDPRAIELKNHEVITIEITPPEVTPPPAFTFPSGL